MDEITLENFRCFREKQTARLAPLTLLVGENSTGKTSFMAMIRELWDVAYRDRIPDFKEEPYDLGSFDEIAHHRGGRGGRAKTFEAGFSFTYKERETTLGEALAGVGSTRKSRRGAANIPYRFEVIFEKKGTVPLPMRKRFSREGVWVEHRIEKDGSWQLRFGTPQGTWQGRLPDYQRFQASDDYDQLASFYFLIRYLQITHYERERIELKILSGSAQPTDNDWKLLGRISETIAFGHPRYGKDRPYPSAPVRSKPHRTYDPARSTRDPEGDYIPMYLANVNFRSRKEWNELKTALEDFGVKSGLFDEISIKRLGNTESAPFQVQIKKYGSGNRLKGPYRNLIDVGYGVSQALPVITELLRRDAPPMFLLQQPEVHLHPSAQAALGSLFCQVAKLDRQLVVETHSDHLLDRVRMDVRDGTAKLKPEDVSILFFERGDLDVNIHSLRLDQEGNILGAPQSYRKFFMDETRRSLKL